MIKPLLFIPLLAQISIAPAIGDSNIAPAIGEQPQAVIPEPQPKPVAVHEDPPTEPLNVSPAPIDIPVPTPLTEESADLAPPLEQPATEDNKQPYGELPLPPTETPYSPPSPSSSPVPQTQAPIPIPQPRQQNPQSPGVAYRQPTTPVPTTLVETIGYPLTTRYAITSAFGWRKHPVKGSSNFHTGTDLAAPHGTPTLAMLSGQVVHADWEGGYGKSVVLKHPGTGLKTRYAHLSKIHVQPGQWVDKGWHIGDSGATGMVTGPHAHIELIERGKHIDPWPYLAQPNRQAVLWKRFHPWAG